MTHLRPEATANDYARRMLPWTPAFIAVFAVVPPMGTALFSPFAGSGPIAVVPAVLLGLAVDAGLAAVLASKVRRMFTRTTVAASPTGVELRDRMGFVVRLRWADITGVGTVEDDRGPSIRDVSPDAGRTLVAKAPAVRTQGIIGWGHRWLPHSTPAHLRNHLAQQPRDAAGREPVAVSFSAAGPANSANPLLAQLRHYRPDLVG
ncbi:hypothetical protein [Streptomonospora arabica]|uniref:PH domain-containing protein n=1 Tax=Streptomonospora arabica TaxID=412417 RepID=A0ABV9SHE2_9ACTN